MAKKKLIIILAILCVALLAGITSLVIVLVQANQSASTNIEINFEAEDVDCTIKASYFIPGVSEAKTYMTYGTNNSVTVGPKNRATTLNPPDADMELTKTSDKIVFEYAFTNNTADIPVKIVLDSIPTATNTIVEYSYSNWEFVTDTYDYLIPYTTAYNIALSGNETKYVYITVKIDDIDINASFTGEFDWALSRATQVTLNTNVENSGAKAYQSCALFEYDFDNGLNGIWVEDWSEELPYIATSGTNTLNTTNTLTSSVNTTLYYNTTTKTYHAHGQTSTSGGTIIPDYYNDGTNGIAPITHVDDTTSSASYIHSSNDGGIYIGNEVRYLGAYFAYVNNSTILKFGKYLVEIGEYAFYVADNITDSLILPTHVKYLRSHAFASCSNITSLVLNERLETIEFGAFYGCYNVTDDVLIIPDSVKYINTYAFHAFSAKEIVIGSGLETLVTGDLTWSFSKISVSSQNKRFYADVNGYALLERGSDKVVSLSTEYKIPDCAKSIGEYVVSSTIYIYGELYFSEGVVSIDKGAFNAWCLSYTTITLPTTLTSFYPSDLIIENDGYNSFTGTLNYSGNTTDWKYATLPDGVDYWEYVTPQQYENLTWNSVPSEVFASSASLVEAMSTTYANTYWRLG